MRFRLALFSISAFAVLFVASTLAQTFTTTGKDPFGRPESPSATGKAAHETDYPLARSYTTATNDWRVHNEEAAIAPIVRALKNAKTDGDVEHIKAQLNEVLEKAFAVRQQRHEQELQELEVKVKMLKELLTKRQENRREIIANRREQILREAQGLGW